MMPGLAQRNDQYSFGFWSKEIDGVNYNQLQKFWSDLSPKARQELLKIDKQTLFEQARKNMYCSRCNGLLLEGFMQIVMHGKSLHPEGSLGNPPCNKSGSSKFQNDCNSVVSNGCSDEMQDPSVHPWGGLTTTRDGSLTLLDCYLYAKSLKGLQNVFDSAPARERERELLYPDACGGGGRGWISQGMASYGRCHGTRETCALHTARLSCDTLVDFWSALSEETRQSLLKMKEEDFMERLRYRFDSKRFCRDCRRNVIREFKELKELKRMRREPRCTSWFCVADTAFQYEVTIDSVQADWRETFADNAGIYHHFEWAIGTGEGKCDILKFENVGMNGRVQVNGLDLRGLNSCYITLRAYKLDGRWSEVSVKAHALKGQNCVHGRLVVGDGFVSIKRGESIRKFFEHAEEAEEEEDEEMMDKDGNELDGECSRPQKHAKSPELAREFLLDAATVIFKEQVEKAFREGTARQNAHSIFVCLTLKLLEQRVHVACKEIITLEKQVKLLEEEEKEKREEEERKEKKRSKEREKKLRRKDRLKEKEKGKEKKTPDCSDKNMLLNSSREEEDLPNLDDETNNTINCEESEIETGDADLSPPGSPDVQERQCLDGCPSPRTENHYCDSPDKEITDLEDENGYFTSDHQKPVHYQNASYWKEVQSDNALRWSDKRRYSDNASFVSRSEARFRNERLELPSRGFNGSNRQLRVKASKTGGLNGIKSHEKFQCCDNRYSERFDINSCSCKPSCEYRAKVEPNISATRSMREPKILSNSDSAPDASKPVFRGNRYTQPDYTRELRLKSRVGVGPNPSITRDSLHSKKVWEPMEPKKYPRSNSDTEVALRCSTFKTEEIEDTIAENSSDLLSQCKAIEKLDIIKLKDNNSTESGETKNGWHLKDPMMSSTSSSDNCSSCLSEGESNTVSSNNGNSESSSTSDSEDASLQSEGRENIVVGTQNDILIPDTTGKSKICETPIVVTGNNTDNNSNNNMAHGVVDVQPQGGMFPHLLNQNLQFPVFQTASPMSYFHQAPPVSWPTAPGNGLIPFPHPNPYLYTGPLGYSMNGDSPLCLQQYGNPLNHTATPFFNPGLVPVFHPYSKTNTEDQAQNLEPPVELNSLSPPETQDVSEDSFSLFHFSGPVGLSTGIKSKPAHSKDGVLRNLVGNSDMKAKESKEVEEYNLFATSNGLRFSLF
ncbi:PREDICTED: uncharacterized protein LOC104792098 isoform X2 [Camelina sativa]|uniref:Uncharacterized protein LOC104792098 isoform X2 n=1 Tax=Camelina sativa TaxID=90675 RepID=A0ABM0ZJ34_CAMSA|nr:PREDICTED: uncharacterized protein LOC104792098 isoform X2 [Camelina sativa]